MSWANWFNVSGGAAALGSPITVVSRRPDHLDLFVTGTDGRIYSTWWHEGQGWAGWFNVSGGAAALGSPIDAIARFPEHLDLFVTGTDGRIYSTWWPDPERRLNFTMQRQTQTNWCWAATSVSVAQYYNPATTWTQCTVANGEWGRSDCCGTGASGPCNQPNVLDSPLRRVGNFSRMTSGTTDRGTIQSEIRAGRPLCARTAWSGGGAHFVAITGFAANDIIEIDDPIFGVSDVDYDVFVSSYQGTGSWTHSYFTQA